ncbi:hypothetical protein YTPLAS73_13530 [Nitrosarchaeum sp.]|nr:hypothetical protein YTPLAS73_13530 [Nitrosarchaeum sp.]
MAQKQENLVTLNYIGEILGILNETNRGRDWLLEQLKKHKISIKTSGNSFDILKECPADFVLQMVRSLRGEDIEGFEDIRTLTKTFHWFFIDIVAASNPNIPTKNQVKKIIVLNELISRTETFQKRDLKNTVILPTGDGMAIGFSDSAEKPLHLAMELHQGINRYNKTQNGYDILLVRIGIDMGPVYVIKDLNNSDNVWGPGIILTRRVMDLAGDMNIFASARIADDVLKLSEEYKKIVHPIGDYSIKHGEELQIFNIYGNGFGNKTAPKIKKVKKLSLDESMRSSNNFRFDRVEILLDVLDTKTMLTRHSWIWSLTNISKESKDQVYYVIDGDSPKDFADLNIHISDERGKPIEVMSINVNKPYHKEFFAKIPEIQPKKSKTLRMQYDWEEPEKNFLFRVPSDCKQMTYVFTIPKSYDSQIKVLKVDLDTGLRIHAVPSPTIKHLEDVTMVSWSKNNLKAFDTYQIFW